MKRYKLLATLVILFSLPARAYEPAGTPEDWAPAIASPGPFWKLLADRLEAGYGDDVDSYVWDVRAWWGGDFNRLAIKTEGEGEQGSSPEEAELQLLYSRLFAPFWEWQIGARHDFRPSPDRSHLVIGIQGVAPYEFEWDSALFLSDEGDASARVEVEYDLKLTQRLILQPRLEVNAAFSDEESLGIGSGVNNTELGLRLRYHLRREFAPYIGVNWTRLYGETRDMSDDENEPTSVTALIIGARLWF